MQIKSLPLRMEQRSEHLGSIGGQNKKREAVSVRKRSLSVPNSTAAFPLTTFQWLVCNYGRHKPLYSTFPIPIESLSLALTGEERLPSQTPTMACELLEI